MLFDPYYHLQNQIGISMRLFQFTTHSHKKQIITYWVLYVVVFNKIFKSNFCSKKLKFLHKNSTYINVYQQLRQAEKSKLKSAILCTYTINRYNEAKKINI